MYTLNLFPLRTLFLVKQLHLNRTSHGAESKNGSTIFHGGLAVKCPLCIHQNNCNLKKRKIQTKYVKVRRGEMYRRN